jgi:hypothetical protein
MESTWNSVAISDRSAFSAYGTASQSSGIDLPHTNDDRFEGLRRREGEESHLVYGYGEFGLFSGH